MALTAHYMDQDDLTAIDLVEQIADEHDWEWDRIHDDQIAMAVEGQWRTYAVTLAWSAQDETLRLICTFDMEPPKARIGMLYEALNLINDRCWAGAFTWWDEQSLIVYRYGLMLNGDQSAGADQVETMIAAAVAACEQYYPALQLVTWANQTPVAAVQTAIAGTYGRA